MFIGSFEPKLDDKGRLILPAKYREQLAGGLVLTRGQERCLYVFPMATFMELGDKLRQAPLTSADARHFTRLFFSGAVDQIPDKQGRFVIPANLRKYANLDRDLVVNGDGERLEIWDAEAWNAYFEENVDNYAERGAEIVPGLF